MGNNRTSDRQTGIDILKCICSFLVVCIHFGFSGIVYEISIPITRIAIIIFFIISGYYYKLTVEKGREKHHLYKIILITIASNIFYLLISIISSFIRNSSFSIDSSILSIKSIIAFVFFNQSPFNSISSTYHLWYLNALIYVLLLATIINKLKLFKTLYFFIPLLLCIAVILNNLNAIVWQYRYTFLFANFLFLGLPCFLVGHLINSLSITLSKNHLRVFSLLFLVFGVAEFQLLKYYGINGNRELYLSTVFSAVLVFMLFANHITKDKMNSVQRLFSHIGQYYSTGVYIIHIFVGLQIEYIFSHWIKTSLYEIIRPVLVFAISCVIVFLYKKAIVFIKLVLLKNRIKG